MTAPMAGATRAMDRPAATPYHQDRTHQTVFKPSANAGTLVPVPTHPKRLVQMARTPTTRALSPAFPVHRVKFPANKEVLNASNVPRDFYNLIRNNQNVIRSKLDQSWPKEDLPRSSYQKGLKLMPLLHPDLRHVQREQKAVQHPMNHVKIALLEHPAHPVPPHAKLATKASLVTKMAPFAKSAQQVPFKIKTPCQVPFARRAQQDTTTVPKD